jgi:hypothetical protein
VIAASRCIGIVVIEEEVLSLLMTAELKAVSVGSIHCCVFRFRWTAQGLIIRWTKGGIFRSSCRVVGNIKRKGIPRAWILEKLFIIKLIDRIENPTNARSEIQYALLSSPDTPFKKDR